MFDHDLRRIATTQRLLVATDFDGTLANLQDDPAAVMPLQTSADALSLLARIPATHVCLISGRSLTDLWKRMPAGGITIMGSYGAEVFSPAAPSIHSSTLRRLADTLEQSLAPTGARIERKSLGVTIHTRGLPPDRASAACKGARTIAAEFGTLREVAGIDSLEYTLANRDKGQSLAEEIALTSPTGVVVFGDDYEDEKMFAVAGNSALTVKVGALPTRANHRVAAPTDVAEALALLAEWRTLWATDQGNWV